MRRFRLGRPSHVCWPGVPKKTRTRPSPERPCSRTYLYYEYANNSMRIDVQCQQRQCKMFLFAENISFFTQINGFPRKNAIHLSLRFIFAVSSLRTRTTRGAFSMAQSRPLYVDFRLDLLENQEKTTRLPMKSISSHYSSQHPLPVCRCVSVNP